MWMRHWGLARDPFAEPGSPYVSLPSHDEAIARLAYAIQTGQPRALVRAARGLGKTTVLRQAIGQVRGPRCRIVVVSEPLDGATLLGRLAAGLGAQPGPEPSLDQAWRSLERAVRVHSLEGFQVVLAIDDCRGPAGGCAGNLAAGLVGLGRLAPGDRRGVTVVQLQQDDPDEPATDAERWALRAGLRPLTRSEAEDYLRQKLAAAGCRERIFTARAITRLQSLCAGVPRGLERLATLSLTAGAIRGIEVVSPEIVDGVAREWLTGSAEFRIL
ncbi:MAG: ExeA family protein [Isosphaeraceae bacterium]